MGWDYLLWAVLGWLASLLVSLLVVTLVIIKMPADYFLDSHDRAWLIDRHPVIRWGGRCLKNLGGLLLVAVGIFLSLPGIPGQGVLTILIGLVLLDFPGKRRGERWFVSRPAVRSALNYCRARFGQPPLRFE